MIDILLPLKKTKVTKCDRPWLTSSIKELILKRQKALHYYGKNSDTYKLWRNQIQQSIKSARFKYYARSVEKLIGHNNAMKFISRFCLFEISKFKMALKTQYKI